MILGEKTALFLFSKRRLLIVVLGERNNNFFRRDLLVFKRSHKHTVNLLNLQQIRVGKIYQSQDQMLL
eukprot:15353627-Ditylum_brightwellii.AAC.1